MQIPDEALSSIGNAADRAPGASLACRPVALESTSDIPDVTCGECGFTIDRHFVPETAEIPDGSRKKSRRLAKENIALAPSAEEVLEHLVKPLSDERLVEHFLPASQLRRREILTPTPVTKTPNTNTLRVLGVLGGSAAVAIGIFAFIWMTSSPPDDVSDSAGRSNRGSGNLQLQPNISLELPDFARDAFATTRWEDLLQVVRSPEKARERMAAYYTGQPLSSPPYTGTGIARHHQIGGRTFYWFRVDPAGETARTLVVEKTGDGLKLDWESFANYAKFQWERMKNSPAGEDVEVRAQVILEAPPEPIATSFDSAEQLGIRVFLEDQATGYHAIIPRSLRTSAGGLPSGQVLSYLRPVPCILRVVKNTAETPSLMVEEISQWGWIRGAPEMTPPFVPSGSMAHGPGIVHSGSGRSSTKLATVTRLQESVMAKLRLFCEAGTWLKKLPYVNSSPGTMTAMRDYYSVRHDSSEPIDLEKCSLVADKNFKRNADAEYITLIHQCPDFPLYLFFKDGSLDWSCYIQAKDRQLEHFITGRPQTPETFRVFVRRVAGAPGDGNITIEVTDIIPQTAVTAMLNVSLGSSLGKIFSGDVPTGQRRMATVELQWQPDGASLNMTEFHRWEGFGISGFETGGPLLSNLGG